MDFSLKEDQKFFRERVSLSLSRLAVREAGNMDRDDAFPEKLFTELGRLGYYGIRYPVELGVWAATASPLHCLQKNLPGFRWGLLLLLPCSA